MGSGLSVSVLNDPCLSDVANPYVMFSLPGLVRKTVSSLMRMEVRESDTGIVLELFEEEVDVGSWYELDLGWYVARGSHGCLEDLGSTAVFEQVGWFGMECVVWDSDGRLLEALDVEKRCVLVMLCWAIWEARNALVWNKKASWPGIHAGNGAKHWIFPQVNSIKINVDVALFERENGFGFGFGVVARDSNDFLVEGCTTFLVGQVELEVAEAMRVREALSWIKGHHWQSVSLETDCLLVVQALRVTFSIISLFGHVIDDCKHLLVLLRNISVIFVKRSVNMVAHNFAKAAILYPDCRFSWSLF
uniref:RNase H type-1 domain-containing protein n=1 Tax=Cannabis sativa TaxID=3483 RepID=A0A803Q3U1_CANSA